MWHDDRIGVLRGATRDGREGFIPSGAAMGDKGAVAAADAKSNESLVERYLWMTVGEAGGGAVSNDTLPLGIGSRWTPPCTGCW